MLDREQLLGRLAFLQVAEQLKDTLRSGFTGQGAQESVPEHTWRLCLMVIVFADQFPELDLARLLKLCVVHDLAEAVDGDIPAPVQVGCNPKSDRERENLCMLLDGLDDPVRNELLGLHDEYHDMSSPEARIARAMDKLETIMQHNQGNNPGDFDYRFNLDYGRAYTTDRGPLISAIREALDEQTRANADQQVRRQA